MFQFLFNSKKKEKLLAWQNVLLQTSNSKLVMTEKQLLVESARAINRNAEIAADCVTILNKTINAETFFSRLDLLKERIKHSKQFEPCMRFEPGARPTDTEIEIEKEQEFIYEFLVRCFNSIDAKAQTLKTERGKANQYTRFSDSMEPYLSRLDNKNLLYFKKHCIYDASNSSICD